jgi:hypothetical protein
MLVVEPVISDVLAGVDHAAEDRPVGDAGAAEPVADISLASSLLLWSTLWSKRCVPRAGITLDVDVLQNVVAEHRLPPSVNCFTYKRLRASYDRAVDRTDSDIMPNFSGWD